MLLKFSSLFGLKSPFLVPNPAGRLCHAAGHRPKGAPWRDRTIFALAKNTGPTFWRRGGAGQALSGSRGESGNHEVAGKIGVITLAALPRNPVNAVKSRAWRRFSLPTMLQRSARRTVNLSKDCRRRHLFFARPLLSARLLGDARRPSVPLRATVPGRPPDWGTPP